MAEQQNKNAIFPDLPREIPAVDKQGNFNSLWSLGLASLFQALQKNFKSEGIVLPSLTTDQANQIAALYTTYYNPTRRPLPPGIEDISGQMIYNTTIEIPQVFIISYDSSTPQNVTGARWWTFTIT